jgi:phosphoribosylformylglycinamidine cyclo-ligase
MTTENNYEKRGVSASKEEVHNAIKNLDKGLFPNAFCKIIPDVAAGDDDYCNLMHADTAGTKTSLAYLYWRETNDISVWNNIVQDAIVMNIDDMACAGCFDHFILSSTIGRNKKLIPGEVLSAIIQGTSNFADFLKGMDFNIHLAGGETADVGDIVRVADIGYTAFSRMMRKDVFDIDIQEGAELVVLSSSGMSTYETSYNSGIGCNGLTSARHDVLDHTYAAKYPESFDPAIDEKYVYAGSKKLTDTLTIDGNSYPIGSLLLSPTRTYLPFIRSLFNQYRSGLQGLIHCTGGGQTKVLKFLQQKRIVKNNLLPVPPIFELIQKESSTDWSEMYTVFNMGQRLEVYVAKGMGNEIVKLAKSFNIDACVAGYVENAKQNEVRLESSHGTFIYR